MVEKALVNPEIVAWARQRSGYSPGLLAKKLNTKVSRYLSWEDGQDQPTFKQAQKLANAVHIPFGYFFLPRPPVESLPIPDLRTVEGNGVRQPSPELIEVVRSVIAKQEWFGLRTTLLSRVRSPFLLSEVSTFVALLPKKS